MAKGILLTVIISFSVSIISCQAKSMENSENRENTEYHLLKEMLI
jgi:hypothetical protein